MSVVSAAERNEIDRAILGMVREMAQRAPVTEESIHSFLVNQCRRRVTESTTRDRIAYLLSAEYIRRNVEWLPGEGELVHYTATADGMDVLDGVKPPRGWQA